MLGRLPAPDTIVSVSMNRLQLQASELSALCVGLVAEMLECAPSRIDPATKFSRLGLDSAMSVQLIIALEQRLGLELSPDVVVDYPTIASLTAHLAAAARREGTGPG
jgi:acyl carrier protein